jgi:hypothetical protein
MPSNFPTIRTPRTPRIQRKHPANAAFPTTIQVHAGASPLTLTSSQTTIHFPLNLRPPILRPVDSMALPTVQELIDALAERHLLTDQRACIESFIKLTFQELLGFAPSGCVLPCPTGEHSNHGYTLVTGRSKVKVSQIGFYIQHVSICVRSVCYIY